MIHHVVKTLPPFMEVTPDEVEYNDNLMYYCITALYELGNAVYKVYKLAEISKTTVPGGLTAHPRTTFSFIWMDILTSESVTPAVKGLDLEKNNDGEVWANTKGEHKKHFAAIVAGAMSLGHHVFYVPKTLEGHNEFSQILVSQSVKNLFGKKA